MRYRLFLLVALICATTSWAQTNISTDQELRNAIADSANIKLTADIDLSNSTLEIVGGISNRGTLTMIKRSRIQGERDNPLNSKTSCFGIKEGILYMA